MNFKTTMILLVALVLVGGYVVYDRFSGHDKETAETSADSKKLFDVKDPEDVNSVTIRSADGSEIVLTKVDTKWRMTKPVDAAAEGWQVDGLVRDLLGMESRGTVDPKGETGLDKPRFNVEMSAKGGKLIKFAVGNKTQLGDLYVKIEGHKNADVVSSEVYDRLGKPANELRDTQLVSVPSTNIKQLVIDNDGQKLVLHKTGNDWQLVEPKKMPADESEMTDLLGAITGLRATDWVAKDSAEVAKAQFDKPMMTVSFTTAAPATQPSAPPATAQPATGPAASQPKWETITFGQYEDIAHQKVYARISDTNAVVKVAATPIDTLTKKPFELRDKRVTDLSPEQVSMIDIRTDTPAGPPPSTKPAKKTEVVINRRKAAPPAAKPATKPAAHPATTQAAATTQHAPTTQTASTWELKSDPKADVDDQAIKSLLADFHPLRVSKYLENTPTTKPVANYVVKITTQAAGGAAPASHELKLVDPGGDQALLGEYNGLSFELPRTFLTTIEGNFVQKPKAATPKPINPDSPTFELPGK
jgi:hypothetical protein